MKTLTELANSVVVVHVQEFQTPFIIRKDRICSITGNVLGNYKFQVKNDAEVYMHLANPALMPNENFGRIRVVCCDENGSMNSTICIPAKAYVLSQSRFQAEKINGSFSSPEAWKKLKIRLDIEASAKAEVKNEGHPKLSIETTSHPVHPANAVNTNEYSCGSTLDYLEING